MCGHNTEQILLQIRQNNRPKSRLFYYSSSIINNYIYHRVSDNLCIWAFLNYQKPLFLIYRILLRRYQQLKYQIDPEYLFSPQNGAGKHERAIVEEFFKVNYTSNFSVERITRPGM